MKKIFALLFVLVILSFMVFGCATTQPKVWYKSGATEDTARRDKMNCRQYGMQSAMANGLAGNLFVEVWIQDETAKCMRELGYQ
jgi:hypothetical protein